MNKDEILQAVKEAVESCVPPTVERVVNGKINKLQTTLETHMEASQSHWEKSSAFMEELQPVREGLSTLQMLNKFFKWVGLPSIAIVIYWLISKV